MEITIELKWLLLIESQLNKIVLKEAFQRSMGTSKIILIIMNKIIITVLLKANRFIIRSKIVVITIITKITHTTPTIQ